MFYQVIAPILQLVGTALICLSSPKGTGNYYSQLLTLKDSDGVPLFKRVECVNICKECQLLDHEEALKCEHVPQTAHWLSQARTKKLMGLYAGAGATAMQEYGGIIVSDYTPVYAKDDIIKLFSLPRYITTSIPDIIFTAFDPAGGGLSHVGICSLFFTKNLDVVVSFILFLHDPVFDRDCKEQCFQCWRYCKLIVCRLQQISCMNCESCQHLFIMFVSFGAKQSICRICNIQTLDKICNIRILVNQQQNSYNLFFDQTVGWNNNISILFF